MLLAWGYHTFQDSSCGPTFFKGPLHKELLVARTYCLRRETFITLGKTGKQQIFMIFVYVVKIGKLMTWQRKCFAKTRLCGLLIFLSFKRTETKSNNTIKTRNNGQRRGSGSWNETNIQPQSWPNKLTICHQKISVLMNLKIFFLRGKAGKIAHISVHLDCLGSQWKPSYSLHFSR